MVIDRLDVYTNPELLGGGMSRVYRATRGDGRVVAVKSVALASEDLARAERRGAELQQQFHALEPRVPDVYAIRCEGAQLLIEMDYIDGEDLSSIIRARGRLEAAEAARVALGLAEVLERAHAFTAVVDGETYRGIVHGDLKPRNVRLVGGSDRLDERIRVLDFGVAKGIRGADGETRNVFGSAPYMSPERLGEGTVSPPSDCWSLGVVLCEMLTGRVPYGGNEREVLQAIEQGPPILPPDCPDDLRGLVHRMLARDLRERLASAAAIREALGRWLDQTRRTGPVIAEPWTPPAAEAGGASPDRTRRTTAPRTQRPRRRLAVLAAVAVLAWLMWNTGREVRVWHESGALGRRVYAAEAEGLDSIVAAYGTLVQRSAFGVGTWPARGPLRTALVDAVDRVILDYRQPEPTVRENQWKQARAWAAFALELDADDAVRARHLICDGHVRRIDGDAALRRGQAERGRRLVNESIGQFERAGRLSRQSPDPWLGLMRVHATSRHDPEQAQAALNEAARRGFTPGPREFLMLGESARQRGEAIERGCDEQRTPELERRCLEQARTFLRSSLDWYDKAVGASGAARAGATAQRTIDRIDQRLEAIDEMSSRNLGLDLLRAAVRAVEAHARKP